MRSCLLTIVLVALLHAVLPSSVAGEFPPSVVTIGVIGDNLAAGLWPILCAIDQINNSTDILPHTHVNLAYIEATLTGAPDQASLLTKTQYLLQSDPVALIGARFADDSKMMAWLTKSSSIPQVSYATTSADMSVKRDFPNFSRVYPDASTEVGQLVALLRYYGWKKVGVLYTADTVGAAMFTQFGKLAKKFDIQVIVSTVITDSNASADDLAYNMDMLAASSAKIFLELCLFASIRGNILQAEVKAGLRRPDIQWIGSHAAMTTGTTAIKFADPTISNALYGQLNFFIAPVESRPEFIQLSRCIDNYPETPDVLALRATNYSKQSAGLTGSLLAPMYDSVMLVGHALHTMIEVLHLDPRTNSTMKASLTNIIRKTSFRGTSGDIALDANGDALIPWTIQQDVPNPTSANTGIGSFIAINQTENTWTFVPDPTHPFVWPNNIVPVDTAQRTLYQNAVSVKNAMIITAALLIGAILVVQLVLWINRDAPSIKATSHTFTQLSMAGAQLIISSVIARMCILNTDSVKTIDDSPTILNGQGQLANEDLSWQDGGKRAAIAEMYLINLGYYLLVGALLVKTWRISRIFNMRKIQTVKNTRDTYLLAVLAMLLLCETAVMIGLHYGDEIQYELNQYSSTEDIHKFTREHGELSLSFPIIYVFRFLVLIPTCIFTFRARNIQAAFNESMQLLVTVYNLAFMSILLPIIEASVNQSTDTGLITHGVAVFCIVATTVGMLVVPKFLHLHVSARDSSDGSMHSHASSSSGQVTTTNGSSQNGINKKRSHENSKPSGGQTATAQKRVPPRLPTTAKPPRPSSSGGNVSGLGTEMVRSPISPLPSPISLAAPTNDSQLPTQDSQVPNVEMAPSPVPSPEVQRSDSIVSAADNSELQPQQVRIIFSQNENEDGTTEGSPRVNNSIQSSPTEANDTTQEQ